MANEDLPRMSAALRLEPSIYSLSSEPPILHLEITSFHKGPITILADNLSVQWMLRNGTALIITDLADDCIIEQTKRRSCRIPPPSSVSVPLIESQLCTLYLEQPLKLSSPFSVRFKRQNNLSLPAADQIQERDSKMDWGSSGVQPLIPGHTYKISLSADRHLPWNSIRWWEYGTKEEVLRRELDGRAVRYGNGPHGSISVDTSRVDPIIFKCTE